MRFTRQFDRMDCGPACVRMIASHFGRNYPRYGEKALDSSDMLCSPSLIDSPLCPLTQNLILFKKMNIPNEYNIDTF